MSAGTRAGRFANLLAGFERDWIQALAPMRQMLRHFGAHARIPEAFDVVGSACHRLFFRPEPEEIGDFVRHLHKMAAVVVHVYSAATLGSPMRSAFSLKSEYSSCHSDQRFVGRISTAVTLYSGHPVAQSAFSVVTTFAPDSGKWKVV